MNILLLSGYDAESHRKWRCSLVENCSEHNWTVLSLPPRYFNWRIRGNGISWSRGEQATLKKFYDLIIATSMVDLATLKGLVPSLGYVPSILYFHENQFAYPLSSNQHYPLEPRMVNLYSALAANRLVFNTAYNLSSFHLGVETLLAKMPDAVPEGIVKELENKSQILPVPLEQYLYSPEQQKKAISGDSELHILWNHRWEYDKGPDKLLACIQALPEQLDLKFHIVGQQFRNIPKAFPRIEQLLEKRGWKGRWGYIKDESDYGRLLKQCHIVLSTALHDFQGLAVLEAVAAGCLPLVPDRLAYTELFLPQYRYQSCFQNESPETHGAVESESFSCADRIRKYADQFRLQQSLPAAPDINHLSWKVKRGSYQELLELVARR
ncbi:Glycosyltransferase [Alteromonadaceae bacterium Bs31]|nr:Glycosyltransferase [Alteromonadaceae bacterium Bs31]